MEWIIYGIWFLIVSFIPLVITIIIYFTFKKYLWVVPASGMLLALMLVIRDVVRFMPPGAFGDRFISYFTDVVALSFYVFYLPIAVLACIYPFLFYLAGEAVERMKHHE